jgi:hypothetical protein
VTGAAELQWEHERQQRLLQAIHVGGGSGVGSGVGSASGLLKGWVQSHLGTSSDVVMASAQRGLAAYVAHAGATAERALVAAFPTVRALVGEETFGLMARAFWHQHPPVKGDLGWCGEALPIFIAHDPQLADVPYLSDVARLDWALMRAETAPDVAVDLSSFHALSEADPQDLGCVLSSGVALIESAWPIVTLWHGHQQTSSTLGLGPAMQALQDQLAQTAWVWRSGWKAQVRAVSGSEVLFLQALLQGASLSQALGQAGDGFDFAACLQQGIQQGWWAAVSRRSAPVGGGLS